LHGEIPSPPIIALFLLNMILTTFCALFFISFTGSMADGQSDCKDSTRRFLVNGRDRTCTWVAKGKAKRCAKGGNTHCPKTCGTCNNNCVDATKRFYLKNGKLKSCDWVKQTKTAKRCNKIGDKYTCRETCGDCSKSGTGEEECEGKNFTKNECLAVGCCFWEKGGCWSAVGNNLCESSNEKYGGCHITNECDECVKSPLKFISSEIERLPSAGNKMSSMMVYGLHLVGLTAEDYTRWCWVAKVITEILSDNVMDKNMQNKVIEHLYKRKVIAKITEGNPLQFKDSFEDSNSICDIVKVKIETENANDQIVEVLEHILHFIHVGETYAFSQWSTKSVTSTDAWKAVLEAVASGVYDISDYEQINDGEEVRRRIILQEFHFWLVFADWNLFNEYNIDAEWKGVNTLTEMEEKLPKTYELYTKTTGKILQKPTMETLQSLGTLKKGSTPDTCEMPTS